MRSLTLSALSAVSVAAFALLLASCTSDKGPLPDAIECERDSDCRADALFCNGHPTCVEQQFMTSRGPWRVTSCERGEPPCASELCDEETDTCACPYPDADGDGVNSISCGGNDCDDTDGSMLPGGVEVCDDADRDEDCNPATFGARDTDGDGAIDAACCNGALCGDDCDDNQRGTHPTAVEACDSIDNDCDGAIDEGVLVQSYEDADGDGWGTGEPSEFCAGRPGYANVDGDCDDELSQVHPGAFRCLEDSNIEFCDGGTHWTASTCPGLGLCVPQPDGTGVCLPGEGLAPQCSDRVDNDDDDEIDSNDPQCTSPLDNTEAERKCANGVDDDTDGLLDFPNDPGCSSSEDNNEDDPAAPSACSNGLDDDNDGTVDYAGGDADPGCVSAADGSEREPTGFSCDNGLNDDQDVGGEADFPADKTCPGPSSNAEHVPACSNGLDDDFDGEIDFGNDLGCTSAADDGERASVNTSYICDNGADEDNDGVSDYPGDPGCSSVLDTTEN
jgi:Putative metal-binding motif